MDIKKMIMPAVMAGAGIGIISSIPIVNLCNVCCLWTILGGALAAFLYAKKNTLDMGSAAVVGAIAGALGGVISAILGFILNMVFNMLGVSIDALSGAGGSDMVGKFGMGAAGGVIGLILGIVFGVLIGSVVGAIGGVLYSAITGKKGKSKPQPAPAAPQA